MLDRIVMTCIVLLIALAVLFEIKFGEDWPQFSRLILGFLGIGAGVFLVAGIIASIWEK
jgi:hypothetical protein